MNQRAPTGGVIVQSRNNEKPESKQDDNTIAIEACATALIVAVHAHDVPAAAEAIKHAFEILDSMPHEEGEHINPHSYDSQNIKAGEEY
jgi:hypothetical protein